MHFKIYVYTHNFCFETSTSNLKIVFTHSNVLLVNSMAPYCATLAFSLMHVNCTVYLLLLIILHQPGLLVALGISPSSKIGPERFAWKIDLLWNMENAICSETWKIRFADKIIRGSSRSIAIWVISKWILNVSIFRNEERFENFQREDSLLNLGNINVAWNFSGWKRKTLKNWKSYLKTHKTNFWVSWWKESLVKMEAFDFCLSVLKQFHFDGAILKSEFACLYL
jgi:hypothetical protein